MKTFIKWSGNKSKHLNKIISYVPTEFNTYIEPFLGSGAMFLYLEPEKWIINDINKDLINCWKLIKDDPEYIISEFKKFGRKFKPMSIDRKTDYCKKITANIGNLPYDIDRAITYMLMKACVYMGEIFQKNKFLFSGLELKISSKNHYAFLTIRNYDNILNVSDFLNETNGTIYNTDYKKVLSKAKKGDFVFLDPPYIEKHDYAFKYNKEEKLDTTFIQNLLTEVQKLDKKGVMWMMTQAETKDIKHAFKKYTIK